MLVWRCHSLEVVQPSSEASSGPWASGVQVSREAYTPTIAKVCVWVCREVGRGLRFLLPVLCIQPGVGCRAGLEAEGYFLGGVALGRMVSIHCRGEQKPNPDLSTESMGE